jgi:hypothetical protein
MIFQLGLHSINPVFRQIHRQLSDGNSMLPKTAFDLAVRNIDAHGDTDIFPFPIENYVLRDKRDDVVNLLRQAHSYFDKCFGQ